MINDDTIQLLKECNAGIKMGLDSINDLVEKTHNEKFKSILLNSLEEHERLKADTAKLLDSYNDDGKEPNIMAKGMSWLKTNFEMMMDNSDSTIAGLITDGCNMGVKSINMYLNQYKAADEKSKDVAKKLINIEEKLADDIKEFL